MESKMMEDSRDLKQAAGVQLELRAFVRESNRIEGIARPPTRNEIDAHERLLALESVTADDLCVFVLRVAKRYLRDQPGMNVRVANHIAPPGGPHIPERLDVLLDHAKRGIRNAYETHLEYETLHPFMDGNGRSGRALWLWQMLREGRDPYAMRRGFLHTFYYQTLSAIPSRERLANADTSERPSEPREVK